MRLEVAQGVPRDFHLSNACLTLIAHLTLDGLEWTLVWSTFDLARAMFPGSGYRAGAEPSRRCPGVRPLLIAGKTRSFETYRVGTVGRHLQSDWQVPAGRRSLRGRPRGGTPAGPDGVIVRGSSARLNFWHSWPIEPQILLIRSVFPTSGGAPSRVARASFWSSSRSCSLSSAVRLLTLDEKPALRDRSTRALTSFWTNRAALAPRRLTQAIWTLSRPTRASTNAWLSSSIFLRAAS